MLSAEGEQVLFTRTQLTEGSVELWLAKVEQEMRHSLYDHTETCLSSYDTASRASWLFNHCAMCILVVEQIYWTADCTKALEALEDGSNPKAMREHLDFSNAQLKEMVEVVKGELTKGARMTLGALIVIDVHARTVVSSMIDVECSSPRDFEWTKQLRYYWEELDWGELDSRNFPIQESGKSDCVIRQTNTRFLYGYEYLGNTPRLVITPLTDKCYMTLMGALSLNIGGAPAGPAGTGKTETTKDLAKALAKHCVVFNCSDTMEHTLVARFFKGFAASGAWCCFDEFNRINVEVLSVIAMQLQILFGAKE